MHSLAQTFERSADNIHDAILAIIRANGGFINTSKENDGNGTMYAYVYDNEHNTSLPYPIKALREGKDGDVEVYAGSEGAFYTEKYLRSERSADRWKSLRESDILFYQTILSIAAHIEEYQSRISGY